MRTGGDTDADHGDVRVLADLHCGIVTLHETAETRLPRHTAELWLVGLHDGKIFGRADEIVVALLGLAPLVLYVTGSLVWWNRRRARKVRTRARSAAQPSSAGQITPAGGPRGASQGEARG